MLRVAGVTVRFGAGTALDGVELEVPQAEVLTVLGPSGCGKTTLLRVIAGLQPPDSGRVSLDGRDVTNVPPHRRGVMARRLRRRKQPAGPARAQRASRARASARSVSSQGKPWSSRPKWPW